MHYQGQVGPASKELKTVAAFDEFLNTDEITVVGFFEKDDSALSAAFHNVAKKLREKVRFAHTITKEVLEKEGYK